MGLVSYHRVHRQGNPSSRQVQWGGAPASQAETLLGQVCLEGRCCAPSAPSPAGVESWDWQTQTWGVSTLCPAGTRPSSASHRHRVSAPYGLRGQGAPVQGPRSWGP